MSLSPDGQASGGYRIRSPEARRGNISEAGLRPATTNSHGNKLQVDLGPAVQRIEVAVFRNPDCDLPHRIHTTTVLCTGGQTLMCGKTLAEHLSLGRWQVLIVCFAM